MAFRTFRLILMLVLLTIWADRLKIGAFYVTPRFGTTNFGQESYPLSLRERAETQETIEASHLAGADEEPFLITLLAPRVARPAFECVSRPIVSGSDVCYLLMSIRR
jgi:hypothetical protein